MGCLRLNSEAIACKHYGQTQYVKHYGTTRAGTQRYRCFDCGRIFLQTYTHKALDPLVKKQMTQMMLNGSGVRYTARVLRVNCNTISSQF
ncbi:IS1-like element transposase [Spirosoma areae]